MNGTKRMNLAFRWMCTDLICEGKESAGQQSTLQTLAYLVREFHSIMSKPLCLWRTILIVRSSCRTSVSEIPTCQSTVEYI
jgi:hypothetical protein